jgi:hypothetical protein
MSSTDTGRVSVVFGVRDGYSGNSLHTFNVERREARVAPSAGYPITEPFKSIAAIDEYLSSDPLPCLLCGRSFRLLAPHLQAHGTSVRDYCERYNLPHSGGLASPSFRKRRSDTALANPENCERVSKIHKLSSNPGSPTSSYRRRVSVVENKKPYPAFECKVCRSTFVPADRRYRALCSKACADKSFRTREPVVCADCGVRLPRSNWDKPGASDGHKRCAKCAKPLRKRGVSGQWLPFGEESE